MSIKETALAKIRAARSLMSYTQREITIREFLQEVPNIDVNPEWQRPDVDSSYTHSGKKSKFQGIIEAIMSGKDIGEIKLCFYLKRKSSIDGGNRKRSIIHFTRNAYPLYKDSAWGEVYFRQLSKEDQEWFYNYKIRVIQYGELTSTEIGEIFRDTNNTTPVNHQEMLNSFGTNTMAVFIRRLVRQIDDANNVPHRVFSFTINGKDNTKDFRYFKIKNDRLDIEEALACIMYRMMQDETPGLSIKENLKTMYVENEHTSEKFETAKKKLINYLDWLEVFADRYMHSIQPSKKPNKRNAQRKPVKLSKNDWSMITRFYLYMQNKYGKNWQVNNWRSFVDEFSKTMHVLRTKENMRVVLPAGEKSKERYRSEAFPKFLSFDTPSINKYNITIEWFLQEFDMEKGGITFTDPTRCFTADQIRTQWERQGRKDWVDGSPISLADACGAHIVAWSKGGMTKPNNLVVTTMHHNVRMGAMNAETYRAQVNKLAVEDKYLQEAARRSPKKKAA